MKNEVKYKNDNLSTLDKGWKLPKRFGQVLTFEHGAMRLAVFMIGPGR